MASTQKDKFIAKKESDIERNKKKSCKPTDNRWVDGLDKMRTQGKGDKNRDLSGWMSEEVTQRLKEIFGDGQKKKANKETNDSQD